MPTLQKSLSCPTLTAEPTYKQAGTSVEVIIGEWIETA